MGIINSGQPRMIGSPCANPKPLNLELGTEKTGGMRLQKQEFEISGYLGLKLVQYKLILMFQHGVIFTCSHMCLFSDVYTMCVHTCIRVYVV